MTIGQATVRKLISEGINSTQELSEKSGLSPRQISDIKGKIAQEISDSTDSSLITAIKTQGENQRCLELNTLRMRLRGYEGALKLNEEGSSKWITLQKQEMAVLRRISELEGVDLLAKIAEKKALSEDVAEKPVRKVGFTPVPIPDFPRDEVDV